MYAGLGIAFGAILVGSVYLLAFHENVELAEGRAALIAAQTKYRDALKALDTRNLEIANSDRRAAEERFKLIGDHAELADAKRALREDLETFQTVKVKRVEQDLRVELNYRLLLQRLALLSDERGSDGDSYIRLKRDMDGFCANPLDYSGAPSPEMVATYQTYVDEVSNRVPLVTQAIQAALNRITGGPVKQLQADVEGKVREERFGEALEMIEAKASRFPQSDFAPVRDYLTYVQDITWNEVKTYVTTRYKDYESPGLNTDFRALRLREAQLRLDKVMTIWGIDSFIEQAKELRAKYP